jgi:hypothetical protein
MAIEITSVARVHQRCLDFNVSLHVETENESPITIYVKFNLKKYATA